MSGPAELQGPNDDGKPASRTESVAPFTDEELLAFEAEPLPGREAMTTLLWAPAPAAIVPTVDELIGDEGT